jgi:hypothetical protein
MAVYTEADDQALATVVSEYDINSIGAYGLS